MRLIFCLVAMLCLSGSSAQQNNPLSVGDPVPDLVLHNIINAPFSSARLSAFKKKVLILDFFATWCSSCINALPYLDSLQRQMPGQLQILVMDPYEDPSVVNRFLKTSKKAIGLLLPFVTGDTLLSKLFPRKIIPHEVWLHNGVFKAVTQPGDITAKHVRLLAEGGSLTSTKFDIMDDDIQKPLQVTDRTAVRYQSLFTSYIEGYSTGTFINKKGKDSATRICYRNYPLATLCKQAYEVTGAPDNRFLYEDGTDSLLLQTTDWDSWKRSHTYCYELNLPPVSIVQLHKLVREDIERSFGITLTKSRRKMNCWVLQQTGKLLSDTGPAKPGNNLYDNQDNLLFVHHQAINLLVNYLNSFSSIPIIDETNLSDKVYMDISIRQRKDINAWQDALRPYGLALQWQQREIDMYRYTRLY